MPSHHALLLVVHPSIFLHPESRLHHGLNFQATEQALKSNRFNGGYLQRLLKSIRKSDVCIRHGGMPRCGCLVDVCWRWEIVGGARIVE